MSFGDRLSEVNAGVFSVSLLWSVVAYFGDYAVNIYSVAQWLPVFEECHQKEEVLLVFGTMSAFNAAGS